MLLLAIIRLAILLRLLFPILWFSRIYPGITRTIANIIMLRCLVAWRDFHCWLCSLFYRSKYYLHLRVLLLQGLSFLQKRFPIYWYRSLNLWLHELSGVSKVVLVKYSIHLISGLIFKKTQKSIEYTWILRLTLQHLIRLA